MSTTIFAFFVKILSSLRQGKEKSAGYEFAVWTIDDEPTARKLIELGVDAITSNCAGYLRGVVEK